MSLQLQVSLSQNRRRSPKAKSTVSVKFSEPPRSPYLINHNCEALESDGRHCPQVLVTDGDAWCKRHARELKEIKTRWERTVKEAERVNVVNPNTAEGKVLKLRQAVDLRRQIRERFYPRGGDTMDFIKWITRLERELRALADTILMSNVDCRPTPVTPGSTTPYPEQNGFEKITILQSPLDPRIPVDALKSIPDDGTILILKHFYKDLCEKGVRRLYTIAPSLNDFPKRADSPMHNVDHDVGVNIVRAWFRIMILNDGEAEVLETATRSMSINEFLRACHPSQLETYYDFFEKAWRPHAVQYLRAAICAQTLTGYDTKTIDLLGGAIPSTTEGFKMTKACWDILYRWFSTLFTPWTLASICSNFEDYTTICRLLMLGLYRENWLDPMSVLTECSTGVYSGFLPSSKGCFGTITTINQVDDTLVQEESRNYVCGQMAIADPLTQAFLDELRRRSERLLLVVYEGTNADATVHPTEPDLFIKRHRSAKSHEELETAEWATDITLEDIKNDLRLRKRSMYDPIVVDSWQFIIIDKPVGLPFQLFDIIQDTLLMLTGDPSPRELAKRVVRDVIPPSVRDIYLEEMRIDCSVDMRFPPPPEVQYEGNRQRYHDPAREILVQHQSKMASEGPSRDANRFIRRVIDDMERCGIISLSTEDEDVQTRPVIIQGSDGALDLYFPYEFGGLSPDASLTPNLTLPSKSCLMDFASSFKQKCPDGILAKGSIMTHYCAWPMPAVKRHGKSRLNFATWEGHVYHWNAMPFDRPWSSHAWQYYLHHYINSKYPFVMFYLTTFVICATDADDAEKKAGILLEETEMRGWRVMLPNARDWTKGVDDLKLEKLFGGVQPM